MPFNANGYVEAYMVNGQSMDTSQFAIETVQQSLPVMRGDNVIPAMDHGIRWRSKRLGARSENWGLWICDNAVTANHDQRGPGLVHKKGNDGQRYANVNAKNAQFIYGGF